MIKMKRTDSMSMPKNENRSIREALEAWEAEGGAVSKGAVPKSNVIYFDFQAARETREGFDIFFHAQETISQSAALMRSPPYERRTRQMGGRS